MPEPHIIADCPRCGTKNTTFDPNGSNDITVYEYDPHGGQDYFYASYELFVVCRECKKAAILVILEKFDHEHDQVLHCSAPMEIDGSLNGCFAISDFVRLDDDKTCPPPKSIPKNIEKIFNEGAICLTKKCWNAAGTMFRQCVDLTTKEMLPEQGEKGFRKNKPGHLGPRITWLFDNKKLNERLKDLANCIKDDGNDGAHDGTLEEDDAEGLLDFTVMLLEEIYTTPAKIKQKEERKESRRAKHAKS